ncbi:ferric/cupric-chelate reductase [Mortierella sp. GBA35]|nr:ferric/cupric-chelate reductase [Mortierella sp. GBA35]
MKFPTIDPLKAFVLVCLLIFYGYNSVEGHITWIKTREWIFSYNSRDWMVTAFCILPAALGHMATIWGHYYRSEREFHHSLRKVTTTKNPKEKTSLWELHTLWGYTVKYWILVGSVVLIHCGWIAFVVAGTIKRQLERNQPIIEIIGLQIGFIGGYSALADCGIILFLVLRRSMLHALGFTYDEVLPLHRWLGALIFFWSSIHTVGYIMYYANRGHLAEEFNFYDIGRSTMNIMGCVAFGALGVLAFFSLPYIRRRYYYWFMTLHRYMTIIFFIGTVVHYPYYVLWYYILPNVMLFYVDRLVPKIIQARTFHPEASITLNTDADIIKMTFSSPEPMKPYYPGDYIMVQVPELGNLWHPFTIASYWPEDPRSITLFIRTYGENKASWTGAMARLCGTEDKRIRVRANVDGVFGDRRHDYLKSDNLIFFVAGAAITTFMALIKAIAAQIASEDAPLRLQLHLICTFRTRSELHAYGSFLHQITRDPRFTSWLHVEIYVSRPDKPQTLMGAHAHVIKNDIQVPGPSIKKEKKKRFKSLRRTGTMLKRALSGRTIVEKSSANIKQKAVAVDTPASAIGSLSFSTVGKHVRSESVDTVVHQNSGKESPRRVSSSLSSEIECTSPTSPATFALENNVVIEGQLQQHNKETAEATARSTPTREMTYDSKRLPTFVDAGSASVATKHARLDLITSAFMIILPLGVWYILRAIHWEGSATYCDVRNRKMTQTQMKICYGSYAAVPEVGHVTAACLLSYVVMHYARRSLCRSLQASSLKDLESGRGASSSSSASSRSTNLPYPELDIEDEKLSVEDGNWDEGDVVFSQGRVNLKLVIEKFMVNGVGPVGGDPGEVIVFGAGPEAFVEHCERQIKKAQWAVDFHRETWAP